MTCKSVLLVTFKSVLFVIFKSVLFVTFKLVLFMTFKSVLFVTFKSVLFVTFKSVLFVTFVLSLSCKSETFYILCMETHSSFLLLSEANYFIHFPLARKFSSSHRAFIMVQRIVLF